MSIIAAVTTVMVAILNGAATGAAEKEGSGG